MKIVLSLILVLVIFWNITVFALEKDPTENIVACSEKEDYELYDCEYRNICLKQEYWTSTDKIVNLEKDIVTSVVFNEVQSIYKYNQNNIYKCWILSSQKNAFEKLVIKLINVTDKTGILKTKIIPKIEAKLEVLQDIQAKNNCITIKSSQYDKKTLKKTILDQSTLELCKYKYYLKFLDTREDDLKNSFPEWEKEISSNEMGEIIKEKKNIIQNEVEHSMKMYPLAFETYVQYDSFIQIHIILELLKEDYRTLRDKLFQTLHPINQVVYKIINAQSK